MGRNDRNRESESVRRADAFTSFRASGSAAQLVRVDDGGNLPTLGDRVYLTHPAVMTSDDAEGSSWAVAVDMDVTIPVIVLGEPAVVDDLLVAHAVGGRWFAEKWAAEEEEEDFCVGAIPEHDLTATLTDQFANTMEVTLTYIPPPNFYSDIYPYWEFSGDTFETAPGSGLYSDLIQVACNPGELGIIVVYDGVNGETPLVTTDPFHAELIDPYINLFSRYTSIIIDDPSP